MGDTDGRLAHVFPRDTDFQNDAFTLLDYAYIGARHDPQYRIDAATLACLVERVACLRERIETGCRDNIERLKREAEP